MANLLYFHRLTKFCGMISTKKWERSNEKVFFEGVETFSEGNLWDLFNKTSCISDEISYSGRKISHISFEKSDIFEEMSYVFEEMSYIFGEMSDIFEEKSLVFCSSLSWRTNISIAERATWHDGIIPNRLLDRYGATRNNGVGVALAQPRGDCAERCFWGK